MTRPNQLAAIAAAGLLCAASAQATPVYLNSDQTTVTLGAGMSSDEPFVNHTTAEALIRAVDAPSADATEIHSSPGTHIWVSGEPLTMIFTFDAEYDLSELHFWNYSGETYDVDEIDFLFYDEDDSLVGTLLDFAPALGSSGGLTAEDYTLSFPSRVKWLEATFSGSNGETDWNNIGFTAELSPPDPDEPTSAVPLPAALPLLGAGLAALGFAARRRRV